MRDIVREIHDMLIRKQKTLAIAESCTGGLLCGLLTRFSGSSQYFILGTVTYSNMAKQSFLKIPASFIKKNCAVSKPIAAAMAKNIRKIAKTDFGIGLTGIAGPTGGTPAKPIGTVFIALATKNKTICEKYRFSGSRNAVRKKSAVAALGLLKKILYTL